MTSNKNIQSPEGDQARRPTGPMPASGKGPAADSTISRLEDLKTNLGFGDQGSPTGRLILSLVIFAGLSTASVFAHLSRVFAWQMLGSFCGILALALLLGVLLHTYPFFTGHIHLRGRWIELGPHARGILPPLLVILVAVGVLGPLLLGQMPLSHDHPVHLYKAWHFWEEMLLNGRLRGWSSFWFFGYPAEELYPIGPDIWVALFRLLTLGLFSWETTYGLAFVGVFALAGYAVYAMGRRYFSASVGVIGGLLWVLDMGAYREGGWSYTVDWAVWVQILAMAFALLFLCRLKDVLERGRPQDYAIGGLLLAAALLSHPMNVIVLGIGLPLFLISRAVAEERPLGEEIARCAGVLVIGGALASFWLLPMLARSSWTNNIGDLWRPLGQSVKGLMDGSLFGNVWPLPVMLGLVGAAVGVAMRRAAALFLICLAAILIFISSSTAFEELSLVAISKSFAKIQYQRLVIPAKACVFLLAGFAIAQLAARVSAWRAGEGQPAQGKRSLWRSVAMVALLAAVLAPFARPALEHLQKNYLRTIGGLVLKKSIHYWDDYQEFLQWSAQKRATSEKFYRISFELDRHNHLMMGAPAFNSTPYYKVGYTPAKLFKHVTETTEDPLYRALSVAYVVSLHQLKRDNLRLEIRFGRIWVYAYKDYRPERYTITGPGEVTVKEFSEERIHLQLRGTGKGSRLKVHVANYARWRARMNGQRAVISEAPVYETSYPMLMEVAVTDGDLVFEYVMGGVDWLGTLATLVGIGLVILLFVAHRREGLRDLLAARLGGAGQRAVKLAGPVTLACAVAVCGFVVYKLARGESGLDERSLAQHLPKAQVTQAGRPCRDWRGDSWFCTNRSWNYVGPAANKFNGAYLPCIWAHPVDEGPLKVSWPKLKLGRALVGHHGLADSAVEGFTGGAPVTLEIQIDGTEIDRIVRSNTKGWIGFRVNTEAYRGREVELSFIISTARAGGRHYCFDARIE